MLMQLAWMLTCKGWELIFATLATVSHTAIITLVAILTTGVLIMSLQWSALLSHLTLTVVYLCLAIGILIFIHRVTPKPKTPRRRSDSGEHTPMLSSPMFVSSPYPCSCSIVKQRADDPMYSFSAPTYCHSFPQDFQPTFL